MLHVFKSISTVYVVQLAVGVITSSHAHILYVFMCFACHILNVFKKNMKNVKLTKMKIFKNLLMHST